MDYEVKCSEIEYSELDIPDMPPITDDMTDEYIVKNYVLRKCNLLGLEFMRHYWHYWYKHWLSKLIRIENNGSESYENIPKMEIISSILEFNRRYFHIIRTMYDKFIETYNIKDDDKELYIDFHDTTHMLTNVITPRKIRPIADDLSKEDVLKSYGLINGNATVIAMAIIDYHELFIKYYAEMIRLEWRNLEYSEKYKLSKVDIVKKALYHHKMYGVCILNLLSEFRLDYWDIMPDDRKKYFDDAERYK